MGQRKILSPRRESNPWPPRYRVIVVENDHLHYDENSLLLKKQSLQLEAHWREAFRTAQEPNKI